MQDGSSPWKNREADIFDLFVIQILNFDFTSDQLFYSSPSNKTET